MTSRLRILSVLGTRPEIVKMAPLVERLSELPWAKSIICTTAQHRDMADQMLEAFGIYPDFDLDIMEHDQPLASSLALMLTRLSEVLAQTRPDLVLAQGDTNTVLAAGLASFYLGIPFGHVEAGLRTGDLTQPFPEEMNRVVAARLASLHFATTIMAQHNLLAEGIDRESIFVTGNTVFEALALARHQVERLRPAVPGLPGGLLEQMERGETRLLLVTAHRRENVGDGIEAVCKAVVRMVRNHPEATAVWPVHPNPAVQPQVTKLLGDIDRVHLTRPLPYLPFVRLLDLASLVLTDSGGVQEEAAALGKPVIVLRRTTERPEILLPGLRELVAPEPDPIVAAAHRLWAVSSGKQASTAAETKETLASEKITDIIHDWFFETRKKDG